MRTRQLGINPARAWVAGAAALGGLGTLLVVVLWLRWFPELLRRETI